MKVDPAEFSRQVALYREKHGTYTELARVLANVLKKCTAAEGISAIVQARAKEVASFAEKYVRKAAANPAYQFTDLCGARVIVESKDQIGPVCDYIRENFEIDSANSEDVIERLRAGEFGYLSVHFIVSFMPSGNYFGVKIPRKFLQRHPQNAPREAHPPAGPVFKAEVQVRTLLQHAWAALIHDNLYKGGFKAPRHLERQAGNIAALLEDADEAFNRLLKGVDSYRSYYGAYMKPGEIREEMQMLRVVQQHLPEDDPHYRRLACRIARMALCIEDWQGAEAALGEFRDSGHAPILRDLGVARLQLGKPDGLKCLVQSAAIDPADPDVFCEIGAASLRKRDLKSALENYEHAFRIAPSYPRALRSFVHCKMLRERSLEFLPLLRPSLEQAIRASQDLAAAGVHLPWAYYDIGFFELWLERPHNGLAAFAKAFQMSATDSPITDVGRLFGELAAELEGKANAIGDAIEWVILFSRVAAAGKLIDMFAAAGDEEQGFQKELRRCFKAFAGSAGGAAGQPADLDKASDALEEAHARQQALGKRLRKAFGLLLPCATSPAGSEKSVFKQKRPVVIVAGGCDASVAQKIGEYRGLVESAFEGFSGTIISGGTTAGISGIVGDLPDPAGEIQKVAYLPKALPRQDRVHPAYTIFDTPGDDYSPGQPLQCWIDLILSGVLPENVRLLGVNGGTLSAFEFRLALTMGAKVGILQGSGREATAISGDPEWNTHPGLVQLPKDEETVRLFIQPPPPSRVIDENDREAMAREAHEAYRRERSRVFRRGDPAMCDWDDLLPSLKDSSLQQIDHIEAKLKRIGLKLRKADPDKIALYVLQPEEIEELARLEHGRWNAERLLGGWRLGSRDPEKKNSPYLVPWEELPEDVREWDRAPVARMPEQLKKFGYEIYRP